LAKALVADSSAAAGRAAAHLLERLGFRVACAEGADEAIALIAGTRPELVLADCRIETAGGRGLIETIRRQGWGGDICLFHVTADGSPSSIRRALDAGADDYIVKPYDEALLRFKLMQARTRGRLDTGRPRLRVVQDNSSTGDTSWRFRVYGRTA
jgi:two-component system chemotaxis response regulator CheY